MGMRQEYIDQWKAEWIAGNAKMSRHPIEFWKELADLLLEGRSKLKNNPLVAVGHLGFDYPGAMDLLVARNNRGIALEKEGRVEAAIIIYELSVADAFFGTHPYDRLRILYSKRHWYEDAVRVCQMYLSLPDRPVGQDKPHFKHHLDKLRAKLKG